MNETNAALIVTDDKMKAFITVREDEAVNEETITKLFQDKGVSYGIDQEVIKDLIKNPRPGTFIVAKGKEPQEGRDGYVQYLFTSSSPSKDTRDDQNVDFREVFDVPSISANTTLAVYNPMVPGEDGVAVTGKVIAARKVTEFALRAGRGATLSSDGLSVVSNGSGRPWVKKQGRIVIIGVDAVYEHEGDIDIKSGNLRFNGDVLVKGNITENMVADVNGNLRVVGFVSRSKVNVTGNLEVMKVITGSKINAGNKTVLFNELDSKLKDIKKSLATLNSAAGQFQSKLTQANKKVQFGQIILALLDNKFIDIKHKIEDITAFVKKQKQELPQEIEAAIAALSEMSGLKVLSLKSMDDIMNALDAAVLYFQSSESNKSNVIANSVWNSEVSATGNITVTGQGAFNSRLVAIDNVEIKGVFRGGEIYARAGVKAGEIGAPMGVKTLVRTEEGSVIKANRVFNGTALQIGSRIHTVTKDQNMVLARIDERGDIILR